MKYILSKVKAPYKPGSCRGCVFYNGNGDCIRDDDYYKVCIDYKYNDPELRYRHYYKVCNLNSNIRII